MNVVLMMLPETLSTPCGRGEPAAGYEYVPTSDLLRMLPVGEYDRLFTVAPIVEFVSRFRLS